MDLIVFIICLALLVVLWPVFKGLALLLLVLLALYWIFFRMPRNPRL